MTQNCEMTLYVSTVRGRKANTSYPYEAKITGIEDLARAAAYDHVSARYRDGKNSKGAVIKAHRANADFDEADNTCMDCDNKQDNPMLPDIPPEEWKTPADVQAAFPDVAFYAVPSRNNMKEKDGLCARPKYHYYFPHKRPVTSAGTWAEMKQQIIDIFPAFDDNAKDAARFMYGVEEPRPEFHPGTLCIDEFLANLKWDRETEQAMNSPKKRTAPKFGGVIPVGQRNSTLSRFAATVLKKYGAEDGKALEAFQTEAAKCEQPLDDRELSTIWNSALTFYNNTVKTAPDYIPPQEYAAQVFAQSLIPSDYTDVGQATMFAAVYGEKAKYSDATKWIVYDGKKWDENEIRAQGLSQELTTRQLEVASKLLVKAQAEENATAASGNKEAHEKAEKQVDFSMDFRSFILSERKTSRIAATLTEARPTLQIAVDLLDKDPYLLNTPAGTVNLQTGKMKKHDPADYCTKITAVAPEVEGADLFSDFLRRVTCNDSALERYLQEVAGMCAVGKVLRENLIIAYGGGGNGKSTLFNLLSRVMGDYAGGLSSDVLITNNRNNKKPELAELRGKRLVIAAELEEGTRLDTATVKKLCSTDPIRGEKKYKDPFDFIPSHTVVLYTNHLPKVGTIDKGTWDRLVVVPFNANLRGMKDEIYNYADYLFDRAGGAVLSWIIEGAKRFIANQYRIDPPECVKRACEEYRASNDWLHIFLTECCEVSPDYEVMSGALYERYRNHCDAVRNYTRHPADFKKAMEQAGFFYKKDRYGMHVHGLCLKAEEFHELPDNEPTPFDD